MGFRFELERCLFAPCSDDGIVRCGFAQSDTRVGKIGNLQQEFLPDCFTFFEVRFLGGNLITHLAHFLLASFGLFNLLLPHQSADFLGNLVSLRLKLFNFFLPFQQLLIDHQHQIDLSFIPCPSGCQPFADKIRPFANQFDVEHAAIIGMVP